MISPLATLSEALDNIDNMDLHVTSGTRIDLGATNQNFITASIAVIVGNFSFVFAAYTNNNGEHFATGVRNASCNNLNGYYR